jgi:ribosome-associated heat shock protein Hsp15
MDETRVDKWLWGVRMFKTRSAATEACRGGHVKVNKGVAKPSTPVRVGDSIAVWAGGRDRVLEVARIIDRRASAPAASECIIDHSPPPPPREMVAPGMVRDRSLGRPTKRERRQMDRVRGRDR